jgi:hypothetical protein
MAIGLRKKTVEAPEDSDEAPIDMPPPILDAEWHDTELDPFTLDSVPAERIEPGPSTARPAKPGMRPGAKQRKLPRTGFATYALYVLLFVTVASLSAAVVLVFA